MCTSTYICILDCNVLNFNNDWIIPVVFLTVCALSQFSVLFVNSLEGVIRCQLAVTGVVVVIPNKRGQDHLSLTHSLTHSLLAKCNSNILEFILVSSTISCLVCIEISKVRNLLRIPYASTLGWSDFKTKAGQLGALWKKVF